MDQVEQEFKETSKKKEKMALKVPFEIDIKKTTRKRNRIELSEDWIGKKQIEKQIIVRDGDITDKKEGFPSFINL